MKKTLWYLFCVTWAIVTAVVLYHFTFGNYGEFDPEQRWLNAQPEIQLQDLNLPATDSLTLVHVRTPYCSCNPLADAHSKTVPEQVAEHWVSVNDLQQQGFELPASPAALIFDGQQLIYAGPYASGAFCAVEDSLIEDILNGEQRLAGTYMNGLVKACRCLS